MEKGQKGMVLINVLDKKEGSVLFKQVLESEVGAKYTLVKGERDLYELSQPSRTKDIKGTAVKREEPCYGPTFEAMTELFLKKGGPLGEE